ncbi:Cd(II)/Pb(II)-responsive transcriptional regulator [Pigmentiphaga sp. NML080357]|uniref:Cd(II)/Pb(II)-responsive transcriptional regulator n=1 Tax=Pigmentiphaga sp. NML080357 TaxID=2008675 RepID=UPI000B41BC08|nr:Cd(II)/Pb(II)-responsive transcriptional regulator [Pigmentiphaga sp. NML080357]OVZ59114.1 Cd(II)/Pb(II)-responsive transcriptional regulator [Pigmentiphaga sp. NML080357]
MKIGELAARTSTPVETIRYYEREGLLPPPARTSGNYRIYGDSHVERLQLVRNCRALDMTLDEIRRLLRFCDAPAENCGEINALLDEHIGHVATRIAELKALQKTLKALRSQCRGDLAASDCGILQGLAAAPEPARREAEHKHGLLGPTHG